MRSIVRRDTGERYQEFLARLAAESGIKTPTREALARLDRRRKKRTSNKDWENPSDPDAKITKMKDGRTHLAHKAEHAVDLDTSALVAVTLHGADVGDTTSLVETAIAAAEQLEAAQAARPTPAGLTEIVADKGYHSNQTMIDLEAVAVRSYLAEPERGRDWTKTPEAQAPVYANRRRVRGARGKRIMRRRGEYVERSFAHMYDTGGLRRTHLRGHHNILKRLLVHAGASISACSCGRHSGAARREGCKDAGSAPARLKSPSEGSWRTSGRSPRGSGLPRDGCGAYCALIQRSCSHAELRDFHHGLLV
jgi:transposase